MRNLVDEETTVMDFMEVFLGSEFPGMRFDEMKHEEKTFGVLFV